MSLTTIGGIVLFVGIGVAIGMYLRVLIARSQKNTVEAKVQKLLDDAKQESKELLLEAKSKAVRILEDAKHGEKEREREFKKFEDRLHERETMLDKRLVQLDQREADLAEKIERVREIKAEVEKARENAEEALAAAAGMSKAEAKEALVKKVEKEAEEDLQNRIRKLETTGLEELERKLAAGELDKYTKKERLGFERELAKLKVHFDGLRTLTRIPDVLFVSSVKEGSLPISEAAATGVKVVGIVNTDADPHVVHVAIPSNDRSKVSLDLILALINKELTAARQAPAASE